MQRTKVIPTDTPVTGLCESLWRKDLPCPNQAEFIILDRQNDGFAVMCGIHKDGFFTIADPDEYEILPYSNELIEQLAQQFQEKYNTTTKEN